jgi:hypothetical protein
LFSPLKIGCFFFSVRPLSSSSFEIGANGQRKLSWQGETMKKYEALYSKAKHTLVKPGDKIPMNDLDWRIVASAAQVIKAPLPGAGAPNSRIGFSKTYEPR